MSKIIGMCVRPLSGHPMEKQQEKTYEKTALFVICYRLILFAHGVFFSYPLLSMLVFLDNRGDSIDVGHCHNCLRRTASQFEFCWLLSIYKGFMPPPNRKSPNVSFPNASFKNTVVSLSNFFKHTQNIRYNHFFPNIQRHTVWQYTSVLRCALHFFSFFTSTAVHICSYVLVCFIVRTIVCLRSMSTCFHVTSYISPLVWRTAVNMSLLES